MSLTTQNAMTQLVCCGMTHGKLTKLMTWPGAYAPGLFVRYT